MTGGFEGEGGAPAGNPNRPPDDPRELRDAFAGECCLLGCSRFLVLDVLGTDRRVDEFGCSDRAQVFLQGRVEFRFFFLYISIDLCVFGGC